VELPAAEPEAEQQAHRIQRQGRCGQLEAAEPTAEWEEVELPAAELAARYGQLEEAEPTAEWEEAERPAAELAAARRAAAQALACLLPQ
jgi:hypothetical protein